MRVFGREGGREGGEGRKSVRHVHWRLRVGRRRGFVPAAVALRAVGLGGNVVVVAELVLRRLIGQRLLRRQRRPLRRSSHDGRPALDSGDARHAAPARPALAVAHPPVGIGPHVDAPEDGRQADADDERRQRDGHRHFGGHAQHDHLRVDHDARSCAAQR